MKRASLLLIYYIKQSSPSSKYATTYLSEK